MGTACQTIYEQEEFRELSPIRPGGLSLTDRALEHDRFTAGSRVLDIGCGHGATVAHLRVRYGIKALGVDPSATMLKEAARYSLLPSMFLVRAAGEALPFSDGCFQGVLCECVLSGLAQPEDVLHEAGRVLDKGGLFIVSDIYDTGTSFQDRFTEMMEKAGFRSVLWEDHSHRLREFAAQLVLAGKGRLLPQLIPPGSNCRNQGYYLFIARKD